MVDTAYVHTLGGASGDMLLGALVDLGMDAGELKSVLNESEIFGFDLVPKIERRGGVSGTFLDVVLDETGLKGKTWKDFIRILERSPNLSDWVVEKGSEIIHRLAQAEASVHNTDVDHVHLHELGTIDTIVDVVGVLFGFEKLGTTNVYCSALPTGLGSVNTEHGLLPVPVPAVVEMLAQYGMPTYPPRTNSQPTGEMLTPTGVAILSSLATFTEPVMLIDKIGYGLGSRDPKSYPNVLGIWLGTADSQKLGHPMYLLETNMDDMTGEMLGYTQEKLLSLGVRDVWFTHIQMKKNRPAVMLSAIASEAIKDDIIDVIMKETSTLGVRVRQIERVEAERRVVPFKSSLGKIPVKIKVYDGRNISVSPEYEDCRRIAIEKGISLQEVYRVLGTETDRLLLSD